MLRHLLVLSAAMLAATACGPLSARPLVAMDVIDRDSGQWLPDAAVSRPAAGSPAHPAIATPCD